MIFMFLCGTYCVAVINFSLNILASFCSTWQLYKDIWQNSLDTCCNARKWAWVFRLWWLYHFFISLIYTTYFDSIFNTCFTMIFLHHSGIFFSIFSKHNYRLARTICHDLERKLWDPTTNMSLIGGGAGIWRKKWFFVAIGIWEKKCCTNLVFKP